MKNIKELFKYKDFKLSDNLFFELGKKINLQLLDILFNKIYNILFNELRNELFDALNLVFIYGKY